jgi:hypothetical protein
MSPPQPLDESTKSSKRTDRVTILSLSTARASTARSQDGAGFDKAFGVSFDAPGQVRLIHLQPQDLPIVEVALSTPPHVHEFARLVAEIPNVKGVIAEQGEDGTSIHVTTFAENLSEDVRKRIYMTESDLMLRHPNFIFDFHLRREEDVRGVPLPISGKFYYAIWRFPDAEPAGASSTSGRE